MSNFWLELDLIVDTGSQVENIFFYYNIEIAVITYRNIL